MYGKLKDVNDNDLAGNGTSKIVEFLESGLEGIDHLTESRKIRIDGYVEIGTGKDN